MVEMTLEESCMYLSAEDSLRDCTNLSQSAA